MTPAKRDVVLGLGLIGIGREWGVADVRVPEEAEVRTFLESAFDLGIRFFDTAPSYAYSEQRLGSFLQSLTPIQRKEVTIATKFGERWDFDQDCSIIDHRFDGLMRSIENSRNLLGDIDILYVHKSTPEVLRDDSVIKALEQSCNMGIPTLGASVKDLESATIACSNAPYFYVQIPYNTANTELQSTFDLAQTGGRKVAVNRPFNMGQLFQTQTENHEAKLTAAVDAYLFVMQQPFNGVILTGTKSIAHLQDNIHSFHLALTKYINQ